MAQLCIHLRLSPADYYALTLEEHTALVEEWNRTQKSRR